MRSPLQGFRKLFLAVREAILSAYAVASKEPDLVFDFASDYYRTSGSDSTFADSITHARASNATMVDSDGLLKWGPHNLLVGTTTLTGGFSGSNLETITGDETNGFVLQPTTANAQHSLNHSNLTVAAASYTYEIEAKANGYNFIGFNSIGTPSVTNDLASVNLSDGTTANQGGVAITATDIGDGWYRIKYTIPYTASGSNALVYVYVLETSQVFTTYVGDGTSSILVRNPALYRSDLGGMVDNPARGDSYVPTTDSARYLPRVGHHLYNGNAWVNEGLLHESEARTNLVDDSNDFSTAGWWDTNSLLTLTTASTSGPDGNMSGVLFSDNASSGTGQVFTRKTVYVISASTDYTLSVYAKANGANYLWLGIYAYDGGGGEFSYFNLSSGSAATVASSHTATIQGVGGGWYRCSITAQSVADLSGSIAIGVTDTDGTIATAIDGTSSIYLYGAQLEAGSTPSSYIPTSGSTVTRAADTLTVPSANLPWPEPVVIGPELVTNGTFDSDSDWIGWTISGGVASVDSVANVSPTLNQNIGATNDFYAVTLDVISTNGTGTLEVYHINLGPSKSFDILSTGTKTVYLKGGTHASNGQISLRARGGFIGSIDNVSVREIDPLSVSIQMDGAMTYADTDQASGSTGDGGEVAFFSWRIDAANYIYTPLVTNLGVGTMRFWQEASGASALVQSSDGVYSPGTNVPYNIASRHGSTFINGATDGTALTANTTPTALPDLSATDLNLGYDMMGTIKTFRVWDEDLADEGIEEATAPTFTDEFAMVVTTTTANETFTIPCQNVGTFDAGIEWGDGSVSSISAYNDAALTHTYANAGDHLIRITGSFPNIYFNNAGDKLKVKSVENLGDVGWLRLDRAFFGCSNMTSFVAGDCDTSSVTNMDYMFRACSSVTSIDLSNFNTSSVTSMLEMFYSCPSLTTLNVSNFNTSSVTDMGLMFRNCSSLTTLDVSGFDTSSVTSMSNMFRDCPSLTTIDVSNFDTSSVTNMFAMFYNCSSLTTLDVSSFDTSSVTNIAYMFFGCTSLTALDVSSFNTSSVTNMLEMFYFCSSLTSLDPSSFDTSSVTSMSNMFRNCSSLTTLDVSNFDTSSVTNMFAMFYNCSSLTDIVGVEDFSIEGLNSTTALNGFATNVTLPTSRYDALLINWDAQEPFDNITPDFGNSQYTAGGAAEAARANLISNDGWTITDGGAA